MCSSGEECHVVCLCDNEDFGGWRMEGVVVGGDPLPLPFDLHLEEC